MNRFLAVGNLSKANNRDLNFFFHDSRFEFLNTGPGPDIYGKQRRSTGEILADANRGNYDLVVAGKSYFPAFNPRKGFIRNTINATSQLIRQPNIAMGWRFPFAKYRGRLAILDMQDAPIIDNSRFGLLAHCACYFKRELPQNPCNAFLYTTAKTEEGSNVPNLKFFQEALNKLRPFSLGLNLEPLKDFRPDGISKKTDVFFAGSFFNHINRQRGVKQLEKLQTEGYAIDIARERLPLPEFLRRCAQAHLVWSPEGGGWDCYRHYEAAYVGSVPLMINATIHRYAPLMDETHAIYYQVEGEHLAARVKQVLQNRAKLIEMGQAGRKHVLQWHTFEALANHVVAETQRSAREF